MQPRKKSETVIYCSHCGKNIKVANYRVHMWFCAGTDKINPVLQNMFKSQLMMSKKLQDLIKSQNIQEEETFPCVHCSFPMTFKDLDTHPRDCVCLPIECPYCKTEFPKDLLSQHDVYCESKKKQHSEPYQKAKSLPTPHPKKPDEPVVDQHVQFLMRELAQSFGIMKSKALTNKELIDLHKSCYKTRDQTEEGDVCAICDIDFEEGQNLVKLPCGHRYHRRCICGWFTVANTCPLCRFEMEKKK